jgi:cystathionine beta-lyase
MGDGEMGDEPRLRSEDELRALGGVKWRRHGAALAAWVADMDLSPPPCALDAVADLARTGDFGYNFAALERLPSIFADWQTTHHRWTPDPDHVLVFNDVLHAITQVIHFGTEPGDGIVLLTPVYPPFLAAVGEPGRRLIDVPLDRDGWRLDPERLRAAIDPTTTAILLCSPHNPTGRVFDRSECEAIGQVVVDHDLLLISDEVWADLTHPGSTHQPMAALGGNLGDEVAARTVTVSSASKAFNLAGLRSAVAHFGPPELRRTFTGFPSHFLGAVGTPGAAAMAACWEQGAPWLAATRSFLTDRRDQVVDRVARDLDGIDLVVPEATYLAWLDCTATGLGGDPAAVLLDRAEVALSSGTDFGPGGEGFARLNTATSPDLLDRILDRIKGAIS